MLHQLSCRRGNLKIQTPQQNIDPGSIYLCDDILNIRFDAFIIHILEPIHQAVKADALAGNEGHISQVMHGVFVLPEEIGNGISQNGGIVKSRAGRSQIQLRQQAVRRGEDGRIQLPQLVLCLCQAACAALYLAVTVGGPNGRRPYALCRQDTVVHRNDLGCVTFPGQQLSGDHTQINIVAFSHKGEGNGGYL